MTTKTTTKNRERAYRNMATPLSAALRAEDAGGEENYIVEGYAAIWDEPYLIWEAADGTKYYEIIKRNALEGADMRDIILRFDHQGKPYARKSNGTLTVEVDERGLHIRADLSKTEGGRELYREIAAGMITAMSWGFYIREESYDKKTRTFTIRKIAKVFDVSAVTYPANEATEISARARLDGVIELEQREASARRIRALKLKLKLNH